MSTETTRWWIPIAALLLLAGISLAAGYHTQSTLSVSLTTPAQGNSTINHTIQFTCSATSDSQIKNMTLVIWNTTGIINRTVANVSGSVTSATVKFNVSLAKEGWYQWYCNATDVSPATIQSAYNFTVHVVNASQPEVVARTPDYITFLNETAYFVVDLGTTGTGNFTCWLFINETPAGAMSLNRGKNLLTAQVVNNTRGTWRVGCNDSSTRYGASDLQNFNVSLAGSVTQPNVTLQQPLDGLVIATRPLWFMFNATAYGNVVNCSLYTSVTGSMQPIDAYNNVFVTLSNYSVAVQYTPPAVGTFTWNVRCVDVLGQEGWGVNRTMSSQASVGASCSDYGTCDAAINNGNVTTVLVTGDYTCTLVGGKCIYKRGRAYPETWKQVNGQNHVIESAGGGAGIYIDRKKVFSADEVIFVLDESGSMNDPGTGDIKINNLKTATNNFINTIFALNPNAQVGLAAFSKNSRVLQTLTNNVGDLTGAVNGLKPKTTTAIGKGIITGVQMFSATPNYKVMILVSDGNNNEDPEPGGVIAQYVEGTNIPIYTLAVGSTEIGNSFNMNEMAMIASSTGGQSMFVADPGNIEESYDIISNMSLGTGGGVTNITVGNFTLKDFDAGVMAIATENSTFTNITILNATVGFYMMDTNKITISDIHMTSRTTHVTTDNAVNSNYVYGILFDSGRGGTVERSTFTLHPTTNEVYGISSAVVNGTGPQSHFSSSNFKLLNNTIDVASTGNNAYGAVLSSATQCTVVGNAMTMSNDNAMGIYLTITCYNAGYGNVYNDVTYINMPNNTLDVHSSSGAAYGINDPIGSCSGGGNRNHITIDDNRINVSAGTNAEGIRFEYASDVNITRNSINIGPAAAASNGIYFGALASNNNIIGNIINARVPMGGFGLYVPTGGATLRDNVISSNESSVACLDSGGTTLATNTFLNCLWYLESDAGNDVFENTTFNATNGSIRVVGSATLVSGHVYYYTDSISDNLIPAARSARIDNALSELSVPSQITMLSTFRNPYITWSSLDDGNFVGCPANQCQIVSNQPGKLVFNVTHWTNYTVQDGFGLDIWDQTDNGVLFGGQTRYTGNQTYFYANYTNTSYQPGNATNGGCIIDFNMPYDGYEPMTWNSTLKLHVFNRTFAVAAIYDWKVNCSGDGNNMEATDTVNISSPPAAPGGPPAHVPEFGTMALLLALGIVAAGIASFRRR
jgi:hypothetical protein